MEEHSFRKAEVEGSSPSIGCCRGRVNRYYFCNCMAANDTSAEAEAILCRLYRSMRPAEKARRIFSAYAMGKKPSMAGIRTGNPGASEEQIWHRWARRHLGNELYEEVYEARERE